MRYHVSGARKTSLLDEPRQSPSVGIGHLVEGVGPLVLGFLLSLVVIFERRKVCVPHEYVVISQRPESNVTDEGGHAELILTGLGISTFSCSYLNTPAVKSTFLVSVWFSHVVCV